MEELRSCYVTLALCALLAINFAITGSTQTGTAIDTFPESLLGVLRHGSPTHLSGNILVIFFGGIFAEPRLGARNTLIFVIACAVAGTIAQYVLVGPRFIGASGISFGFLSYGVMMGRPLDKMIIAGGAIAMLLALETTFLSQTVAVYVHITGALIGGGLAMFEALFGSKNPTLKAMQPTHIARVVEIIGQTDSDDAAEAESSFLDDGLDGMFVLVHKGEVLGVTGYSTDEQVPDIVWLSWTYLDSAYAGQGHGSEMLNDLLGKLKGYGVRKIFMATSDYEHFGKKIYAAAHKMYEDFGAKVELTVPDYHDIGEAKIVYGLDNPEYDIKSEESFAENTGLAIDGVAPEPETDGVMGLRWEDRPVGLAGIDHALDQAIGKGARMAVLAIPSDLSDANAVALEAHNFKRCGELKNYYNPAQHQVWWSRSLGA